MTATRSAPRLPSRPGAIATDALALLAGGDEPFPVPAAGSADPDDAYGAARAILCC